MIEPLPNTRGSVVYADGKEGSDVYDPLQAHVYGRDESKGLMGEPMKTLEKQSCKRMTRLQKQSTQLL